jgi:CheY-like chemotaxis protein
MAHPKVLVVDDEPSIVLSTARLLTDMGFEVATCGQAADISAALDREQPDVILQDVRMPGLDIEALVLAIRADPRWKRLPIVIFTASMDAHEVRERVEAHGVIDKPFKPEELLRVLRAALAMG